MTNTSAEAVLRCAECTCDEGGIFCQWIAHGAPQVNRVVDDYHRATARIAELETRVEEMHKTNMQGLSTILKETARVEAAEAEVARLREAIHKVDAALADIAEGEPDPDDTAEKIWCKDRAAEGLFIARAALQEKPE